MLGKIRAELKRLHDIIVWNYNMLEKEDAELRGKIEGIELGCLDLKARIASEWVELKARMERECDELKSQIERGRLEMETRLDRLEADAYLRQLKI